MTRMWIVVGDITSSGGRVITGSPYTDIDGKPVSRIGDKATCPRHKGVFPVVDGDVTMIVDGQPVALHGSSLACGCKVLAVRQSHVYVDAGDEELVAAVTAKMAATPTSAATLDQTEAPYDEAFILKSEATGRAFSNRKYRIIREGGAIEEGTTNGDGMTHLVRSERAETLRIEIYEQEPAA